MSKDERIERLLLKADRYLALDAPNLARDALYEAREALADDGAGGGKTPCPKHTKGNGPCYCRPSDDTPTPDTCEFCGAETDPNGDRMDAGSHDLECPNRNAPPDAVGTTWNGPTLADCKDPSNYDGGMKINAVALRQWEWVERMGWHNKTPLEYTALIGSEVGEATNECRGEVPSERLGEELADVVLRVADMAVQFGIDLEGEIDRKMAVNEERGTRGREK